MGKGAFIKKMDSCSQKLQSKLFNGKKEREKGVGLKIMNFQG